MTCQMYQHCLPPTVTNRLPMHAKRQCLKDTRQPKNDCPSRLPSFHTGHSTLLHKIGTAQRSAMEEQPALAKQSRPSTTSCLVLGRVSAAWLKLSGHARSGMKLQAGDGIAWLTGCTSQGCAIIIVKNVSKCIKSLNDLQSHELVFPTGLIKMVIHIIGSCSMFHSAMKTSYE